MQECRKLELLRLSCNQLDTLPTWLLNMPKLAWLAYSSNPCITSITSTVQSKEVIPIIPQVSWQTIVNTNETMIKLGEGASSEVYQVNYRKS
jgi:hypothetical protein